MATNKSKFYKTMVVARKQWVGFLDQFKGKKVCHVSHTDADGVGAIVLGLYFIQPLTKDYFIITSDKYDLSDQSKLDIYINCFDLFLFTDFPVKSELYTKLKSANKEIIICDHHQSGNIELKNLALENYYYDITKCGTKILFDEISRCIRVKKIIYQFVELINIRDLWFNKSSLWKDANGLSNILWGMTKWDNSVQGVDKYINFINAMILKFKNNSVFFFTDYEKKILLNAEKKEQEAIKEAKRNLSIRIDTQGNKYAYTECGSKQSIVAEHLLSEMVDLKYLAIKATYEDKKQNTIIPKISLRTKEDRGIDVASIAELYKSGGHHCAAGIDFKDFDFFIKFKEGKVHLI